MLYLVQILLTLFSFTQFTLGNVNVTNQHQISFDLEESVLCRTCGSGFSLTKYIVSNKLSPEALYTFNDTIFGHEQVTVQILLSDFLFDYPLVTFSHSTCSGIDEWEESTWFPEYLTRPCVCAECGAYLGWMYKPNILNKKSFETFFGFILTEIIGETFVNSLAVHPEK